MAGISHAYYTVALAPAIAALVGIGALLLWRRRTGWAAGPVAALALLLTTVTAFALLGRTPDFLPWLRWVVLVVGLLTTIALLALRFLPTGFAAAVAATAVVLSLAGPTAYAVQTAATAHTGSIPAAAPPLAAGAGGGPGGARPGRLGGPPPGMRQGQQPPAGLQGGPPGGAGGLLDASTPSTEVTDLLAADGEDYTWVAAAIGSNNASGYQLATGEPVMAIGGFNGSDPSPTLADFQQAVAAGKIHYFIGSGSGLGRSMGGSAAS